MQSYYQHIVRKLICPACGEENRVRFDHHDLEIEAPCSDCEVLVRWRRGSSYAHGDGASDEEMSEVVVRARGADEVED